MEIVKKIKKAYEIIVGTTKETKAEIILNHLIDSIELRGDIVHIKTSKNILLENNGHIFTMNSGLNVIKAGQIHLNPKIDFKDNNFSELKHRLDEGRRIEQIEFEKQVENIKECNH